MHTTVTVGELELWMVEGTCVHAQVSGPVSVHVCVVAVVSQSQFHVVSPFNVVGGAID